MTVVVPSTYVEGQRWWYVSTRFDTPERAKESFDKMNKYAARLKGNAQIAGYRLLDDLPEEGGQATIVVVVGQIEDRVVEAARDLGGYPFTMSHNHIVGLIKRRINYLAAGTALAAPPGVHVHNYGEGGMALDDEGNPTVLD